MINTAYVHENDFLESCMQEYEENASGIQNIMERLSVDMARRNDMKALGIYMESSEDYFTESVSDAVSALGQKILDMIEKLKEMLKNFMDRITGKKKVESEIAKKIDAVAKENPKLADTLKIKLSEADFKVDNVKDLNEYYKNVDELIERLKKDDVDPKSIQGKFQKVKDTLDKNANTIKTVGVIISGVVAIGGFALKLKDVKKSCSSVFNDAHEIAAQRTQELEVCRETMRILMKKKQEGDAGATTKLRILADIQNHLSMVTNKNVSGREKLYNKILNIAANTVEGIANKSDRGDANKANTRREENLKTLRESTMKEYNEKRALKDAADRIGKGLFSYRSNNR